MNYFKSILLILILISCKNEGYKKKLRKSIILKYMSIPMTYNDFNNSEVNYNNFKEFKELDLLFDRYSKLELSKKEQQYFAIAKCKRNLLTSNFDKAISEIKNKKFDKSLEDYSLLLIGIANEINGNKTQAFSFYNKVYIKYKEGINTNACDNNYIILNYLLEKENIEECPNVNEKYLKFKPKNKIEYISDVFLNNLTLATPTVNDTD